MGPASDNAGYGVTQVREATVTVASMGPASDNAGYDHEPRPLCKSHCASMGPASDNAGYERRGAWNWSQRMLQWVRRLITPVMWPLCYDHVFRLLASMGPASDNAGYGEQRPRTRN